MSISLRALVGWWSGTRQGDGKIRPTRKRRASRFGDPGMLFQLGDLLSQPRSRNEAAIRSRCQNAYLGGSTALCRILGRYKLYVDTDDIGLSSHLLIEGYWETWVTEAMVRTVSEGMKVADVGANLGYYTILLGDLVGKTGQVHAFEPNAAIASRLRDSVAVNGHASRTTIHETALGDRDGAAGLVVPAHDPKNGHLAPEGTIGAQSIAVRRMDSLPELADVDFIKIDVEGAEELLWAGMSALLAAGRPLIVFLEFAAIRYPDPDAFVESFLAQGFSLQLIDMRRGIVSLSKQELLARPGDEDQLIILRRG